MPPPSILDTLNLNGLDVDSGLRTRVVWKDPLELASRTGRIDVTEVNIFTTITLINEYPNMIYVGL